MTPAQLEAATWQQMADEIARLQARVEAADRLAEALESCVASLGRADAKEGVCCCGDSMDQHSDPMYCGHMPTDMGEYYAAQALEAAADALAAHEATK